MENVEFSLLSPHDTTVIRHKTIFQQQSHGAYYMR